MCGKCISGGQGIYGGSRNQEREVSQFTWDGGPNSGIKPTSFVLAGGFYTIVPLGKPLETRVTPSILKRFPYVGYLCKCIGKINTAIYFGIAVKSENDVLIASICLIVRSL